MKTYLFRIPDDFDLEKSFKMFQGNKIILDKPIDHGVYERIESEITQIEEDACYQRIAACTDKLMKHIEWPYITDPCGGIQALEILVDKICEGK